MCQCQVTVANTCTDRMIVRIIRHRYHPDYTKCTNMETRRVYCVVCVIKRSLQTVYISLGATTIIIALMLSLWWYQSESIIWQQQTTLAGNELDKMVTAMYHMMNVHEADWATFQGDDAGNIGRNNRKMDLLRDAVQRLIATDGTGRADFALENSGASIVSVGETQLVWWWWRPFESSNGPRRAIQASMQPGECFAFTGVGELVIELARNIYITAISVEHILAQMSPDGTITNAPKRFAVYGVLIDWTEHYFGTFQYEIERGPTIQTFHIEHEQSMVKYPMVRFVFLENHGQPDHTCVYRVRVHGYTDDSTRA